MIRRFSPAVCLLHFKAKSGPAEERMRKVGCGFLRLLLGRHNEPHDGDYDLCNCLSWLINWLINLLFSLFSTEILPLARYPQWPARRKDPGRMNRPLPSRVRNTRGACNEVPGSLLVCSGRDLTIRRPALIWLAIVQVRRRSRADSDFLLVDVPRYCISSVRLSCVPISADPLSNVLAQ